MHQKFHENLAEVLYMSTVFREDIMDEIVLLVRDVPNKYGKYEEDSSVYVDESSEESFSETGSADIAFLKNKYKACIVTSDSDCSNWSTLFLYNKVVPLCYAIVCKNKR